jgi:hypothetical protein
MAQTGEMTWQPAVERVAEALRDAYLDGPKVASMDRIPLGSHSKKVERCIKELGSVLYFRGTDKDNLIDDLHNAVTDALSEKLINAAKKDIPTRLAVLDYTPDKALLKKWVGNNLFDLKFSTNKSATPAFTRDLSTPQTDQAIKTAFGTSAAIVVAMGNKGSLKDATFAMEGGIVQKSVTQTARGLFNALQRFVEQAPSETGDYGVHAEIKGLLDKGFNPKFGGIGRFPKPTDPEADVRMLAWAFKKYSSDPNQAAVTREAHEINLRQLKYYQDNLEGYLGGAAADPNQADLVATQIHGTIGQIFNDILFNEKLNIQDRGALYDLLCDEGVLPDPAQEAKEQLLLLQKHNPEVVFTPQLDTIHARRDYRLAQLAALQTLIRSSPLLMEFNPREVSGKIAREAMGGLREAFGKESPLAEEILADALVRTSTGQLDEVAGSRGRFPKIHEAIAQGINQRDKAIEKNCMNMPDSRLDDKALELVPNLAETENEGVQKIVDKIKDGALFAHGMRPNTIQRAHTLPASLKALAVNGDKEQVFQKALRNEAKFLDRKIKELESTKANLLDAANIIGTNAFAQLREKELRESIKEEIDPELVKLQQRKSIVDRLQQNTESLAKPDFKGIPVRDSQGRDHTLQGLANEESVAKMIHNAGHRTLCSISGTTTDIGLALVAQYGEATVKVATASLLDRANALKNGTSLPPLDGKFQSLFATLSFFMQGGQYHTPAEVLGGLLIVAASLHSPEQSSNKTAMVAAYKTLLEDFAKNPADYMIANTEVAKKFTANLAEQKIALHKTHRDIIAAGSPGGLKPWKGVKNGDLPSAPGQMHVFFDDSSLPSARPMKFLINRARDDSDQPLTPLSSDRQKATADLRSPAEPQNSSTWGKSLPFQNDLTVKTQDGELLFKEPQPARVDKNEFQKRNLDFAGSVPSIRRHEGFWRERKLARLRAAEEDLAALKAQQGKDITSPVKDSLGTIKNAEGFVPKYAQEGSSQQVVGDEIGDALGVLGYGAGMLKGYQKQKAIAHNLHEAEESMTRLQQRKQEVEVSKKNLDAQFKNLERLDSKKSHAELMGRMIEQGSDNKIIREQAQKLPQANEAYQKALAARHADTETHAKLVAKVSQSPDEKSLETQIEDLRYKRGENYSKLFLRYPAGLAASGTGLAVTFGQQAGTIAARGGAAWFGKVFAFFGAISVAVSGWRIVRNWKANNRLEAMVKNADAALANRREKVRGSIASPGKKLTNKDIDQALAKDSLHLLLTAEKKSLKQQIRDNQFDSWGIELPSLISGAFSLASAALWMAGVTGAVILGPIALGLGLVGCAVGVGIAIHRLKRTGQTQNRMADAQEGLAALQNDPSKLEELRKSNPRVKAAAKALEKAGTPVTADAVIQKLEQFLSIRYVNVTAQAVYRDLLAELDAIAQTPEAKAAFLPTSGRLPGPESDPSGDKQAAYLKLANNSPVLQTLREHGLNPLEISRIVHAGTTGEGVKRLLAALNLKEIKTDSFAADANLEDPLSARTEFTALQSGSAVLHGNRFDSGMDAALTALKRNPGLLREGAFLKAPQTKGGRPNFENFLKQPMITGTEARELRQEMKQHFFTPGTANAPQSRSANMCLQEFTEKMGGDLAPTNSTHRAFLGQEATPESTEALFIARFEQNGKPIRTAFDPLLPLTNPDKTIQLQPNTIICHKGTHRDRGVYITYTREGTQWYRNASGKSTLVDIRPENIAAKLKLPHDHPEKRHYDLIREELEFGSTAVVYGEPVDTQLQTQATEDFELDDVFYESFDSQEAVDRSTSQKNEEKLQKLETSDSTPITSPGIGLSNGANNCFMNAALAAFRGIDARPLENNLPRLNNYLGGKVATEGQARALREEIARNLKDFPNDIKIDIRNGSSPDQHDAAAVFQALLDASDFPKLKTSEKLSYELDGHDSTRSNMQDKERCLALPIKNGNTMVQSLVDGYFNPEQLNDYQPEGALQPIPATKVVALREAPAKLAIQIKRFAYNEDRGISRMSNSFDDVTRGVHFATEDGSQHTYQPKGIICHLPGRDAANAKSGHYVYFKHLGGNNWCEINDGTATDFDITQDSRRLQSIKNNCYVVTYEKQNP